MGKHRTSPPTETGPDPNGNLLSLIRNAHLPAANYRMDQFKYHYQPETNRLMRLEETAALTPQYEGDIEPNDRKLGYAYDEIGNLVTDGPENFNISWYANGKVHEVNRGAGVEDLPDIAFTYDGAALRTTKLLRSRTGTGLNKDTYWTKTYYVRDAQGNVMAVYKRRWNGQVAGGYSFSDMLTLAEHHLYGSTRLGMRRPDFRVATRPYLITGATGPITEKHYGPETTTAQPDPARAVHALGRKRYELTNHLGNVLATVSDNVWATHQAGTVTGFEADVKSATDYYGFGMGMPGRVYHSGDYRYGYQGAERDDELKGSGNSYNFNYRMYDPRIGRTPSRDPHEMKYPSLSPYSFVFNNPINVIDPDGRDGIYIAFPDYKADGYSNTGHAGILLIDNKTGLTKYYEYGRYDKAEIGIVRHYAIPDAVIGADGRPTAESLNKIMTAISKKSGKGQRIEGAYFESDKFKEMNDYAQGKLKENSDPDREPYAIMSNNCGTFACDVAEQDEDLDTPWIVDPRPVSIVQEYQDNFTPVEYKPGEGTTIEYEEKTVKFNSGTGKTTEEKKGG